MDKKKLPSDSLNVDVNVRVTSKDAETPESDKASNKITESMEGAEDNVKTKIDPLCYSRKVSESLQANMDKNEKHIDHVEKSSNAFSSADISVNPTDQETSKPNTFENRPDTIDQPSFEVKSKNKDELPKYEVNVVLDHLKVDIDKNKMDTSNYGDKPETLYNDIPKFTNNKVSIKSIKDEEILEFVENEHKQKQPAKKVNMKNLQNENEHHLKDDDIFLANIKIDHDLEKNLAEVPGALDYIKKLHHLIHKHIKKIRKLRKKLCELGSKQYNDCSTQTDEEPQQTKALTCATEAENITEDKSKPKSLAEDIAEAAQMAVQNSGFVYEETSGMYYDYNTGYYYNAEYGLYYDGSTGTYMTYNQDTQTYEFHSQEQSKKKCKENKDGSGQDDIEEGECSDSSESSVTDDESSAHESDSSDISKAAPCMRVIVEASEVPSMKIGSLFIITRDGGSLGREGHHSIIIGDLNVSKHHLKFTFEDKDGCSRNGTLLNGKRLSPSKQESELSKIQHGSKIQIGSTILLCHIHDGSQTCGHCEPGLLQEQSRCDKEAPRVVIRYNRAERHKNELKSLKKLCGIKSYNVDSKLAEGYTDRAQRRRDTVGSQNPHEKTQAASVDESISKENKGFKMLQKMGWKEGESLGKENEGIVEPIKVIANQGKTGIGADVSVLPASNEKSAIWVKTQERFNKLPESEDILGLDSD
nr:unnamed protein product [Callosobruchus chinensis]